jgi:small GTP-binding protein
MGAFNTGKSTFLNALLGESLLSVDVLPATAAVTVLRHGNRQMMELHGRDNVVTPLPISYLREFSTESTPQAAASKEELSHIEVMLPNEILRHVTLVDTPGVNSPYEAHTNAMRSFIDRADAVIWVIAYGQALNDHERHYIESLPDGINLLVLVNHIDERDPEEDSLVQVVNRVRTKVERDHVLVVPVSAKLALDAVIQRNPELLAQSNWLGFQETFQVELFTKLPQTRLGHIQVRLQNIVNLLASELQTQMVKAEQIVATVVEVKEYQLRTKYEHQGLQHTLEWLKQNTLAHDKVEHLVSVPESIYDHDKVSRQLQILKSSLARMNEEASSWDDVVAQPLNETRDALLWERNQLQSEIGAYNRSGLFGGRPLIFTGRKDKLERRSREWESKEHTYLINVAEAQEHRKRVAKRVDELETDCLEWLSRVTGAIEEKIAELMRDSRSACVRQKEAVRQLSDISWLREFAKRVDEAQLWQLDSTFRTCAEDSDPTRQLDLAVIQGQLKSLIQRQWNAEVVEPLRAPVEPLESRATNWRAVAMWLRAAVRAMVFATGTAIVLATVAWIGMTHWKSILDWAGSLSAGSEARTQPEPVNPAVVLDGGPRSVSSPFMSGTWDVGLALSLSGQYGAKVILDAPFVENGLDHRFLATATEEGSCPGCLTIIGAFFFTCGPNGWTIESSNSKLFEAKDLGSDPQIALVLLGPEHHGLRVTTNLTDESADYSEVFLAAPANKEIIVLWSARIKERECRSNADCTSKELVVDLVPGASPDYYDLRTSPSGGWAAPSLYTMTAQHDEYKCVSGTCEDARVKASASAQNNPVAGASGADLTASNSDHSNVSVPSVEGTIRGAEVKMSPSLQAPASTGVLGDVTTQSDQAPDLSGNWQGEYTNHVTNRITKVNLQISEDRTDLLTGTLMFDEGSSKPGVCSLTGVYNTQNNFMLLDVGSCKGTPPKCLQGKIGFSSVKPTDRRVFGVDSLQNCVLDMSRQ